MNVQIFGSPAMMQWWQAANGGFLRPAEGKQAGRHIEMALAHPTSTREEERRAAFTTALTAWYDPTLRPFKWRDSSDLYFVTVCEVLLQRTNAEKVAAASAELFLRFPQPEDLSVADAGEVAHILQPLGLPRRVGQLQVISRAFAHSRREGRVLSTEELRELPGVGPYVLAATRVLALGEVDAVIDEHVLRIFRRVFSIPAPARRHPTRALIGFARELVPPAKAREYNLAILDLGRLVCRPTNPRCDVCPVRAICDYAQLEGGSVGRRSKEVPR